VFALAGAFAMALSEGTADSAAPAASELGGGGEPDTTIGSADVDIGTVITDGPSRRIFGGRPRLFLTGASAAAAVWDTPEGLARPAAVDDASPGGCRTVVVVDGRPAGLTVAIPSAWELKAAPPAPRPTGTIERFGGEVADDALT